MSAFASHIPSVADACMGKTRYPGRHSAEGAKRVSNRCGNGDRFGVYQCPHCHWWHVGHVPMFQRRRKRVRRRR